MEQPIRLPPREAYKKAAEGSAKLVCAYEDEQKCRQLHLEKSITFNEFQSQISALGKGQEIIFYCT